MAGEKDPFIAWLQDPPEIAPGKRIKDPVGYGDAKDQK
jgi:hypothetical protein